MSGQTVNKMSDNPYKPTVVEKTRFQLRKDKLRERSTSLQIIYALIAYFTTIAPSMSIGFSAVALPPLTSYDNPIRLSVSEASWFASIASVATPVGCFVWGPIADRYGRKSALLLVNCVCFIGWLIVTAAYKMEEGQYAVLIVGRLFTGLSTGLASMPAAVYMAEVSSSKLRGVMTTSSAMFFALGIVVVYILGYIFENDWGSIAGISAILPCLSFVITYTYLPESPLWLVSKNRTAEAAASMRRIYGFRGINEDVISSDIAALVGNRDASRLGPSARKSGACASLSKKVRYLRRPSCFKPFVLITAYFFFQQFSGVFVVVFYAIDIVTAAGVVMDAYLAIVLIALIRFFGAMLVSYVSLKVGRRPLSIISGVGMTVCMLILATYSYLKHVNYLSPDTAAKLTFIPFWGLLIYFFTSTLGFLTMPFALNAECFPSKIRGLATGLIVCLGYIFNFIIVKIYPTMIAAMHAHGLFLFYGAVSLAGTIFIICLLPETKGKTLVEIEEYFSGKKSKNEELLIKT